LRDISCGSRHGEEQRDEAIPSSVIPGWCASTRPGIFDYAGVKDSIADMFDRPVDVVSRESLKPRLRPKATADAIYAF
jgi:predicted nucleotidyltransferase